MGDELMAAGEAAALRGSRAERVGILDAKGQRRWHEVWDLCPDVAPPSEATPLLLRNAGNARPYIDYSRSTPKRWCWQAYTPKPARLALPRDLVAFAQPWAGSVVIEPNMKAKASPAKDWGWDRWQQLVALRPDVKWLQLGMSTARLLRGVRHCNTRSFAHALAVLSVARAAVLQEGGLHHGAAAVGCPAVVIFGGFIAPWVTGYPSQVNLFTGGEPCGWRRVCPHCAEAMAKIPPQLVAQHLDTLLETPRA